MFQLRRRGKRDRYWHLSDSIESHDEETLPQHVIQLGWDPPKPSPVEVEATTTTVEKKPRITLKDAMVLQTRYTSWPSSIWELNFDDADGEIVFDYEEDELSEGDGNVVCHDYSSPKSVGTLDTDDETMPSLCASPEFQNTWELEDLDLSAIVDEESFTEDEPLAKFDPPDDCNLLACSANLHEQFRSAEHHRWSLFQNLAEASIDPDDSNYFLIEESFGTTEPSYTRRPTPKPKPRRKLLRFADEVGKAMETVHLVDCSNDLDNEEDDPSQRRVLILLLLPEQKKYEFVHAAYSADSRLLVSALLRDLPKLASDRLIRKQRYNRLVRVVSKQQREELINSLPIQSYELSSDEVLVAVLKGYAGDAMYSMAKGLVENETILSAVKKTNHMKHILHSLKGKPETRGTRPNRDEVKLTVLNDEGIGTSHSRSNAGINIEIASSIGSKEALERPSLLPQPHKTELPKPGGRRVAPLRDSDDNIRINTMDEKLFIEDKINWKKYRYAGALSNNENYDSGLTANPQKAHDTRKQRKKLGSFVKNALQRMPSPIRARQEEVPANQSEKPSWTSRFAKKHWGKLKTRATRMKETKQ